MISMPSESRLNLLCKHRRSGPWYPDMDFGVIDLVSLQYTMVINRYIPEIHLAIMQ